MHSCTLMLRERAGRACMRSLVKMQSRGRCRHRLTCSPAQVWDSQALQCLRTLEGHEDNVRVLAVGDSYVFSGSWDKSIRSASVLI